MFVSLYFNQAEVAGGGRVGGVSAGQKWLTASAACGGV